MRISLRAIPLPTILLCISACSSLERGDDLVRHQLIAHQSTKTQVVNNIGLPRTTEKSRDGEVEFWYYTGKPVSSSYFVPVPFARSPMSPGWDQVRYRDLGVKDVVGDQQVVMVCVFDRSGQLVDIYYPKKN